MTNVNLVCWVKGCRARARRPLCVGVLSVGGRGVHETPCESAQCPNGHGYMVRVDGRRTADWEWAFLRLTKQEQKEVSRLRKKPDAERERWLEDSKDSEDAAYRKRLVMLARGQTPGECVDIACGEHATGSSHNAALFALMATDVRDARKKVAARRRLRQSQR